MNALHTARSCVALAVLALVPLSASFAANLPLTSTAQIPFVNFGGIYNWKADREKGIWIEDAHHKWYYATLLGPCLGLDFATHIGFDTRPVDTFDRFSKIVVPGYGRCTVQNFTASDPPPAKQAATK